MRERLGRKVFQFIPLHTKLAHLVPETGSADSVLPCWDHHWRLLTPLECSRPPPPDTSSPLTCVSGRVFTHSLTTNSSCRTHQKMLQRKWLLHTGAITISKSASKGHRKSITSLPIGASSAFPMSRKFIAALSGTYNVHANELAHGGSAGNVQQISGSSTGAGSSLLPAAFAKFVRQQSVQQSPPPQIETIKCVVHFLDDTQHIFEVDVRQKFYKMHFYINFVFLLFHSVLPKVTNCWIWYFGILNSLNENTLHFSSRKSYIIIMAVHLFSTVACHRRHSHPPLVLRCIMYVNILVCYLQFILTWTFLITALAWPE